MPHDRLVPGHCYFRRLQPPTAGPKAGSLQVPFVRPLVLWQLSECSGPAATPDWPGEQVRSLCLNQQATYW